MTAISGAISRRTELSAKLALVEERILASCRGAGRAREDIQLIVVTKFFPGSDVELLCDLGVTDIGESRDQEASAKVASLPRDVRERLHVHFIGQVQSNKAGSVAAYADTVHSVDREKLVVALDRAASAEGRDVGALVQVSLDGGAGAAFARGGIPVDGVAELADCVAASHRLRLRGLMAVAPQGADPAVAFATLARVARDLRGVHPRATWISAGMSADLEPAIANGATHLRVGSAILGSRPLLR